MTVQEALERALIEPVHITLDDVYAAQRWVWRAHNHINRKANQYGDKAALVRRLMIVRRWNTITVMLPHVAESGDAA
jgi:hypothetical protein